MSKIEKLIQKIFDGRQISYDDAERVLLFLGFELDICSSHHIFRKKGYQKNISIKKRSQLKKYQIKDVQEALINHDYEKN